MARVDAQSSLTAVITNDATNFAFRGCLEMTLVLKHPCRLFDSLQES